MSDFKIIFVHGYTASSDADWYPSIKPELDKLNIDYVIPNLPGNKKPKSDEWIEIIHKEVQATSKPIVFVGHSLGTRAVLLYLDKHPIKVRAVFLVAPLSNDTSNSKRRGGETYPSFFEHKIDLSKIKPLSDSWTIMHSKDDSSLEYNQHGVALSKEMGIKLNTYQDKNHFCKPENAQYVLKELREELKFN